MADEPESGTALAMLSREEQELENRARYIAAAVASEMVERHFDPERIEDMRDVRQQITRAAEHAAYEAIKREREGLAHDLELVRRWSDTRLQLATLAPAAPFVSAGDGGGGS